MKALFFYTFFALTFHNISTDAQIQSLIKDVEMSNKNTIPQSDFTWTDNLNAEENNNILIEQIKESNQTQTISFLQF